MKKRTSKRMAWLLALSLVISLFAGCAGDEGSTAASSAEASSVSAAAEEKSSSAEKETSPSPATETESASAETKEASSTQTADPASSADEPESSFTEITETEYFGEEAELERRAATAEKSPLYLYEHLIRMRDLSGIEKRYTEDEQKIVRTLEAGPLFVAQIAKKLEEAHAFAAEAAKRRAYKKALECGAKEIYDLTVKTKERKGRSGGGMLYLGSEVTACAKGKW